MILALGFTEWASSVMEATLMVKSTEYHSKSAAFLVFTWIWTKAKYPFRLMASTLESRLKTKHLEEDPSGLLFHYSIKEVSH